MLRRSSPEDTGLGGGPPAPPASPRGETAHYHLIPTKSSGGAESGRWRRGEGGAGGALSPQTRIFWGASPKRETRISWLARVAEGSATQRGLGRERIPRAAR